jgi:hypothetical protein
MKGEGQIQFQFDSLKTLMSVHEQMAPIDRKIASVETSRIELRQKGESDPNEGREMHFQVDSAKKRTKAQMF